MRAAQKEAVTTHGMDGTPTYRSWVDMKRRCYSPQRPDYHRYGGRGITVCEAWRNSFEAFFADMGMRPDGKTLDRIHNDKAYEPGNCKWSTRTEQGRNTRTNRIVVVDGISMSVAEAAEKHEINAATIISRLGRGWSDDLAVKKPLRGH